MSVHAFGLASSRRHVRRPRKPTLEDRAIARMLGRWIDRELAHGTAASVSEAHMARVQQLTEERTRNAVALSLERLIERADGPVPRFQVTPTPCREQVHRAERLINATAARLRSAEPLDARGIAHLKTLLADVTGPCYVPSAPDALTVTLRQISRSLDVGG